MRVRSLGLFAALASLACSAEPERVDEPYGGVPFPERRTPFTLPEGPLGVVSNSGSDTLTLLDLQDRTVIGSAPVGLDPVDLDGPHHVAVDRGAGAVFTALSYPPPVLVPGPHAAHGSSQRRGIVLQLALDGLSLLASTEVDVNPGDIVLSADGSRLFVSHFDLRRALAETDLERQRASVTILDAATLEPVRAVQSCVAPHGMALGEDRAFVACYGEDALAVIDLDDDRGAFELVSLGPGGAVGSPAYGPYAAVLSPDGQLVAVSNIASLDLRLFEVTTGEFRLEFVPLPGAPFFPAWSADGARLFVPTQGVDALLIVSPEEAAITGVRYFDPGECPRPHAAAFAGDDDRTLYLVCEGDQQSPSVVLALDAESLDIETRFDVGVYPDGIAIADAP